MKSSICVCSQGRCKLQWHGGNWKNQGHTRAREVSILVCGHTHTKSLTLWLTGYFLLRTLCCVLGVNIPEPRRGVLLELYVHTVLFCRESNFNREQTSVLLSIVKSMHQANTGNGLLLIVWSCAVLARGRQFYVSSIDSAMLITLHFFVQKLHSTIWAIAMHTAVNFCSVTLSGWVCVSEEAILFIPTCSIYFTISPMYEL